MAKLNAQPHIVIVGAGIGGLALAHALARYAYTVTLVEQAEILSEIGAGIGIWENGLDALDVIGLKQAAQDRGLPWPEYEIHRTGKHPVLKDNRILSKSGEDAPLMIKRGALFSVLKDALPGSVNVITGFKVSDVSDHNLTAQDGREMEADIIIGADGARSVIRKALTAAEPQFCKQVCYRGIASDVGSADWTAAEFFDRRENRVGYFRLPDDQAYWFSITDSEEPFRDFNDVKDTLKATSPTVADLIDKTPQGSILCHPIEEMPPVKISHDYIALLGDAAHPMQPSLGQGACLALEDAVVLARCLGRNMDNPKAALQSYISKRQRRWASYYKMCRQLGTGALYKGMFGRRVAIWRMVHTPKWSLKVFGRKIFEFKYNPQD